MEKLSVFVTTFNNARTLRECLQSVAFADELVVLDSHSSDDSEAIARAAGATFIQHEFLGYGRQKQLALEHTSHRWVLFLDADEVVSSTLADELRALRDSDFHGEQFNGYAIARNEQVFWRMSAKATRKNYYIRLFKRDCAGFSEMPVHATVEVSGAIGRLREPFFHFGETDIHTKVEKINGYSTGLVRDKLAKKRVSSPWIMVVYPPLFFLRSYLFKRGFCNGWAGFIASVVGSFYVFLKYAKVYEQSRFDQDGARHMPPGAPPLKSPLEHFSGPI
ncbi:MAG: glycosyltransferase family 2 protein [Chromatiales bacterium]|nr:glycosyltransferase family 2 protein [Chromatiales bacterium]